MNPKTAIVTGAGAWGGWTAYMLQKAGIQTTLIDKAGPGNVLSGSGGQSRVIRMAYGGNELYTQLTQRAYELWELAASDWAEVFYHETGALWLFRGITPGYATLSKPLMTARGFELEELNLQEAARRFPQVNLEGITSVFYEPRAGYLEANRACAVVKAEFEKCGGQYRQDPVASVSGSSGVEYIQLDSGEKLIADFYVFAAGPWTSKLLPALGRYLKVSRQEVYYFTTPEGHAKGELPLWIEFRGGDKMYYGIPGGPSDGFKFAYDERTWSLNPDRDDRSLTPEILIQMSAIMHERFPAMKQAELLRHHTCVYESSPDGDFIIDRISGADNALMLCGSSGHGYKMGPAIGEMVADYIVQGTALPEFFSLQRLKNETPDKTQYEVEG